MKTGLSDLDFLHLEQPKLILLSSRPGMGKSTLALNIATNVVLAQENLSVMFSLESTKDCILKKITSSQLMKKVEELQPEEEKEVIREVENKLYIEDDSEFHRVKRICSKISKRVLNDGVKFVVIDYMDLLEETEEVVLESLKELVDELKITILVLSNLSRKIEDRTNHRPVLTDFRNQEMIEKNVDSVLFLYRDDYYYQDKNKDIAELIVAKRKENGSQTIKLACLFEYHKFVDFSQ